MNRGTFELKNPNRGEGYTRKDMPQPRDTDTPMGGIAETSIGFERSPERFAVIEQAMARAAGVQEEFAAPLPPEIS